MCRAATSAPNSILLHRTGDLPIKAVLGSLGLAGLAQPRRYLVSAPPRLHAGYAFPHPPVPDGLLARLLLLDDLDLSAAAAVGAHQANKFYGAHFRVSSGSLWVERDR